MKLSKFHKSFYRSIEVSMNLGIDPRHADQMVRGVVSLPNGNGKKMKVAVFAKDQKADEAREAGADVVGAEDLAEDMQKGNLDYDRIIATPDLMGVVGRIGKVLGPKGLMPNPKTGTVTEKVGEAINNAKSGQVRFRTDKNGILHGCIGKVSFSSNQIQENAAAMLEEVKKLKPATAKGAYIQSVALSSTMGPGVKVAPASFIV